MMTWRNGRPGAWPAQGVRRTGSGPGHRPGRPPRRDRGACWGPTARARPRPSRSSRGTATRTAGEVQVLGHDPGARRAGSTRRASASCSSPRASSATSPRVRSVAAVRRLLPRPAPCRRGAGARGARAPRAASASGACRAVSGGDLDLADRARAAGRELRVPRRADHGFDPSARRTAWGIIRGLVDAGTTVLLTTHFMDEAQALADRLIVLVDGRIVAEGTTADVIGRTSQDDRRPRLRLPVGAAPPEGFDARRRPGHPAVLLARTTDPTAYLHRLTGWAVGAGVTFEELAVARPIPRGHLPRARPATPSRSRASPWSRRPRRRRRRR